MYLTQKLADRLCSIDYDLSQLTYAERGEIYALARAAGVELPHQNESWASTPAATLGTGIGAVERIVPICARRREIRTGGQRPKWPDICGLITWWSSR